MKSDVEQLLDAREELNQIAAKYPNVCFFAFGKDLTVNELFKRCK